MKWLENENGLNAKVEFNNQTKLAEFVVELAKVSEAVDHHADLEISYNKLNIRIITHDANSVTLKDWDLARRIEEMLSNFECKHL